MQQGARPAGGKCSFAAMAFNLKTVAECGWHSVKFGHVLTRSETFRPKPPWRTGDLLDCIEKYEPACYQSTVCPSIIPRYQSFNTCLDQIRARAQVGSVTTPGTDCRDFRGKYTSALAWCSKITPPVEHACGHAIQQQYTRHHVSSHFRGVLDPRSA